MQTPPWKQAAPLFAALGDETRLGVLRRLSSDGPQSITRLTTDAAVSRQAVTKHLALLEAAGLVKAERRGRERVWSLQAQRLALAERWLQQLSAQWDARVRRLAQHLKRP